MNKQLTLSLKITPDSLRQLFVKHGVFMLSLENLALTVMVLAALTALVCVVVLVRDAWTAARVPKRKAEFGRRAKIMGLTLPLEIRLLPHGWYIGTLRSRGKRRLLRDLPPSRPSLSNWAMD